MSAKHLTGRRRMCMTFKTVNRRGPVHSPDSGVASNLRPEPGWGKGRPGLVPFVSCRPGAYGRLLLTVYEW